MQLQWGFKALKLPLSWKDYNTKGNRKQSLIPFLCKQIQQLTQQQVQLQKPVKIQSRPRRSRHQRKRNDFWLDYLSGAAFNSFIFWYFSFFISWCMHLICFTCTTPHPSIFIFILFCFLNFWFCLFFCAWCSHSNNIEKIWAAERSQQSVQLAALYSSISEIDYKKTWRETFCAESCSTRKRILWRRREGSEGGQVHTSVFA